jgi:hypothetical protein
MVSGVIEAWVRRSQEQAARTLLEQKADFVDNNSSSSSSSSQDPSQYTALSDGADVAEGEIRSLKVKRVAYVQRQAFIAKTASILVASLSLLNALAWNTLLLKLLAIDLQSKESHYWTYAVGITLMAVFCSSKISSGDLFSCCKRKVAPLVTEENESEQGLTVDGNEVNDELVDVFANRTEGIARTHLELEWAQLQQECDALRTENVRLLELLGDVPAAATKFWEVPARRSSNTEQPAVAEIIADVVYAEYE